MIYITGDTHADFRRFKTTAFPEQKEMTKEDYVIILGDFGGIWSTDPQNREENYWLDWLEEKNFTTLFIDGNHENFDRLDALPVREWNGGKVHEIRPSILHLMRGQIFRIDGKSFFTFGGARSYDIRDGVFEPGDPRLFHIQKMRAKGDPAYLNLLYRINRVSWWPQEMPAKTQMQEGTMNLQKAGWNVDYVLTHCLPSSLHRSVSGGLFKTNELTDYLDYVRAMCTYRAWLCGHYHWDRDLNEREKVVYERILRVEKQP